MNNIVITSAGQRVSLVRSFQKELKKYFSNGKVFTVDLNPQLSPACQISDGSFAVPKVTNPEYIKALLDICLEHNIKIIIPTIDTELIVLAKNQQFFSEQGIVVLLSSLEFVEKCRDKRNMNLFFTDHHVDIPKTISKENPTFPLFIKPYDGSLSKDIYLINNQEELMDYHLSNPKLMFMEYINPEFYDEYTIDAYYNNENKLICAVPRKRLFVRAGEINKGVTKKNILLDFLQNNLNEIKGAIGCLTMQFFLEKNEQRIIGIEINPRFGGGYPLSYSAGANYPEYIIKEYIKEEKIEQYFENWEENLLMLRYDDEILVRNYEN